MVCGRQVRIGDPVVRELSELLRAASPGAAANSKRFRNTHGVARKIWRFADRLAGRTDLALSAVEESVWQEYASDATGLAVAASRIRVRLAVVSAQNDSPSHGPPPATFAANRECHGVAWLYVAALDGIVTGSNEIFVKVGRSNDVRRREADLNFALPRRLGLRWRMVATWEAPTAMVAHVAEQAILRSEAAAGRSAGGEFLIIKADRVRQLIRRCEHVFQHRVRGPVRSGRRESCRAVLPSRMRMPKRLRVAAARRSRRR